ncbi:hypothetical protein Glove_309g155 [Diversispora epigaea]|uniref:Uncharacterized protein n=1 Tax=Diversispora epigaea TaxID=1348612 RepID=A0A397HSD8_9GLOM|nr:hypothetical protein Glove_309g155 [Diversispora epigaea]
MKPHTPLWNILPTTTTITTTTTTTTAIIIINDNEDNNKNEDDNNNDKEGKNKDSEIVIQIKKDEEFSANQESTNTTTTTTTPLNYQTQPQAIYTSRLLNYSNLPKPKNKENFERELEELTEYFSHIITSKIPYEDKGYHMRIKDEAQRITGQMEKNTTEFPIYEFSQIGCPIYAYFRHQ